MLPQEKVWILDAPRLKVLMEKVGVLVRDNARFYERNVRSIEDELTGHHTFAEKSGNKKEESME